MVTMKALVLTAPSTLETRDVPVPEPGLGEVRISVQAVGICGSDVHGYDGSSGRRIPPLIMGHEASGVIDSAGPGVTGWKPGDRVTFDSTVYRLDDWYSRRGSYHLSDGREVLGVATGEFHRDGCYAEYVVVPQHILFRIPEGVTFEHAALVEPYGVAMHAVTLGRLHAGQSAVVVGCGTIGLCLIQILAAAGATPLIGIDLDASRRVTARSMGASDVFDPRETGADGLAAAIRTLTGGRGADASFEAVGAPAPLATAVHAARRGGTVVLVGNLTPEAVFPYQAVVTRELRLQGSCSIGGEYDEVLALLAAGRLSPDRLVSAVAPLEEGAEWFRRLGGRPPGAAGHGAPEPGLIKVILRP